VASGRGNGFRNGIGKAWPWSSTCVLGLHWRLGGQFILLDTFVRSFERTALTLIQR
jgi:hypothetical protein